jgi:hypothetical protein
MSEQIYILKRFQWADGTPRGETGLRWNKYQRCGACRGAGDVSRRLSSPWVHERGGGRKCLNCRGEGYHWVGYAY